jgi:hypothetical protein
VFIEERIESCDNVIDEADAVFFVIVEQQEQDGFVGIAL